VHPEFHVVSGAATDKYGEFLLIRPSVGDGRFDPARLVVPDQQGRRSATAQLP
jgi:hypothetical protein